jgi:hypothetical protein
LFDEWKFIEQGSGFPNQRQKALCSASSTPLRRLIARRIHSGMEPLVIIV